MNAYGLSCHILANQDPQRHSLDGTVLQLANANRLGVIAAIGSTIQYSDCAGRWITKVIADTIAKDHVTILSVDEAGIEFVTLMSNDATAVESTLNRIRTSQTVIISYSGVRDTVFTWTVPYQEFHIQCTDGVSIHGIVFDYNSIAKRSPLLALSRQLASETLRADRGWDRYEQRNRYALGLERQLMEYNSERSRLADIGHVRQCTECAR